MRGAAPVAVGELAATVLVQDLDDVLVEGDGAVTGGDLRFALDKWCQPIDE